MTKEEKLEKIKKLLDDRKSKQIDTLIKSVGDLIVAVKAKPEPHFIQQVPSEIRIANLPEKGETQKIEGEVEIKNLPKILEVKGGVEIKNWPKTKEIQKVEITNLPEEKEMEKPSWVDSIIDGMLTKLATLLATVAAKTVEMMVRSNLTVEFLRPQPVIMVDARGKALKFNEQARQTTTVISGGSSTASSAVSDPVTGYKVADTDEVGTTKYYGFINKAGNWYIMKNDTTANTFRFSKGSSNYPTGWTGRAALTYDYFNIIFA